MRTLIEALWRDYQRERASFMRQILLGSLTAVFVCGLLTVVSNVYAAFELKPLPPAERGSATGLAEGTAARDSSTSGMGRAGWLRLRSVQAYGFRPYGLQEVSFIGASAEIELHRDLDLSLAYHSLSALSYIEQTYAVSCKWSSGTLRLRPSLRLGTISLDHSLVDHALIFDITCRAQVLSEVEILLAARNPFALGLVHGGERCPVDITAGLRYTVSQRFTFGIEASKQAGFPNSIATGVEMRLVEDIRLRTGIRSYPKEFCMGLGLRLGPIALDMAASLHLDLGVTHEAGLTYRRE